MSIFSGVGEAVSAQIWVTFELWACSPSYWLPRGYQSSHVFPTCSSNLKEHLCVDLEAGLAQMGSLSVPLFRHYPKDLK